MLNYGRGLSLRMRELIWWYSTGYPLPPHITSHGLSRRDGTRP